MCALPPLRRRCLPSGRLIAAKTRHNARQGRGNGGLVHGKCQSLADSLGQTDHQDHLEPRRSTTSGVASLLWIEVEGEVRAIVWNVT